MEMHPDKLTLMRIGVANEQIPRILYKYTTIDVLKLILQNRTIKFSSITEFNDKKECFAVLDFDCTPKEWQQYIAGINPEQPRQFIRSILRQIRNNPKVGRQWITQAIKDTNRNLGILCLTCSNSNELMWAHYAAKHSGVCLEFDISKDPETFFFPKKVEYSDNTARYNYIRSWIEHKNFGIIEAFFHKSAKWAYEEEYRVVRIDGAGLVNFDIESLRSVCFGIDTPEDKIIEIRQICNDSGFSHIKFLKNTLNEETGNYEIKEYI